MITAHGVATVARQELKLRIRAGRWRWLLAIWFALLGAVTTLTYIAVRNVNAHLIPQDRALHPAGVTMYGGLMLFVLALALLVVPALTAQSVNGDRERGVLATLQVTLLTPMEIALGKLAAAWGVAVVFLALTAPWVGWSYAAGGVSVTRIVVVTVVMVALLGVFCATSLALSALLARTTTSAVLSYLTVFAATIGTLVAFGLLLFVTTEKRTVPVGTSSYVDASGNQVTQNSSDTYIEAVPRPDRVWWVLAPNPFVILADAAPVSARIKVGELNGQPVYRDPPLDPLSAIGNQVRHIRQNPIDEAVGYVSDGQLPHGKPVWPTGLGFDVALGAAMVWLTARRLRTPWGKLPRGQRVA